jgi:triacylglycerol lipase
MSDLTSLRNPTTYEINPSLFLDQAIFLARVSEMAYEADPLYAESVLKVKGIQWFPSLDDLNATTKAIFFSQKDVSVLSFQGSFSASDWASNARFVTAPFLFEGWGNVHQGFYDSLLDCIPRLIPRFLESSGSGTIWLTGHSRGGAIAVLAAAYIKAKFDRAVNVMTYGQPMAATSVFCKMYNRYLNDSTFRFITQGDPVPSLPGVVYEHCGKPKKIKREAVLEGFASRGPGALSIDDEEANPMDRTEASELMDRLASGSVELNQPGVDEGLFRGASGLFEPHKMVSYITGLESIKAAKES